MLDNILANNPSNLCAIIQDDDGAKGTDIFQALLKLNIDNDSSTEVHLVCCNSPPDYYLSNIDKSKIIVHNVFQDPNCWLNRNQFDIKTLFNCLLIPKNDRTTIMIDSLNYLINFEGFDFTYRLIHKLKMVFRKIICLLHINEIICSDSIKRFMFLSQVYMKLYPYQSNNLNSPVQEGKIKLVETTYVKPSGKMTNFKELIIVDEHCHLKFEFYFTAEKNNVSYNIKDHFRNITTFRIGLDIKENERKARDNLILPYMKKAKDIAGEEGKIIYYADSDDDLEEDPDDDLNI